MTHYDLESKLKFKKNTMSSNLKTQFFSPLKIRIYQKFPAGYIEDMKYVEFRESSYGMFI